MPSKNDCWGIEVGSHAIKAVRLVKAGGNLHLEDYAILPFKQVLTTPDINVEEAIQVNLDTFLSKHDVSKSTIIVSVPGNKAFARFASLPPVETKKIPDIVKFEAVQQIPFPIEEVEWDYQVFQQDDTPDVKVGIFAITKERIAHFLSNFNAVNLRVDAVTLSPLAVYNAFSYESPEEQDGTIYIDIGTESTDVIIVDNGTVWTRTLQIGGNNFTNALVESFKLSFPKAEKLKREARTSKYARQIFQAMRPVFADLVQEVQRSLGYYKSINRDTELNKIVGLGSTFKLPGLQKFLKQQLQIDVSRPSGYSQIDINGKIESDVAENAVNLATAYGLALQGLGEESLNANILPDMLLRERMWKAKQPWFAGAAAAITLVTFAAVGVYLGDNSATDKSFQSPEARQVDSVLRLAKQESQKYDDVSTEDPRVKIENLYRILDYRDLWPSILADISEATDSLVDDDKRELQLAAFTADYTKLQELAKEGTLPRAERQRIYIDSIKADYIAEVEPEEGEDDSSGMMGGYGGYDPYGMDDGMMGGYGDPYGGGGSSMTEGAAQILKRSDENEWWKEVEVASDTDEDISDEVVDDEEMYDESGYEEDNDVEKPIKLQGPRIVLTIEGTTPYKEPLSFLVSKFLKWFKEHGELQGKPYTIEVPKDALVKVERIGDLIGDDLKRSTSANPYGGQDMMGSPEMAGMDPYAGGFGEDPYSAGAYGANPYSGGGASYSMSGSDKNLSALIPVRPLEDESKLDDHKFTIKLYVNLRKPSETRTLADQSTNKSNQPEAESNQPAEDVANEEDIQANTDSQMNNEEVQA